MKTPCLSLCLIACTVSVQGAPRSSANYSLAAEAADSGGHRSTSANYTHNGSAGLIAGVSTVSTPAETAKAGYIGQLYEVSHLMLSASPATVNETATCQLSAWQLLDDASRLAVSTTSVAWTVLTGPVTDISATGLATAGTVHHDSSATALGVYAGAAGSVDFTVLDSIPDNFGTYAGDGLADDWQFDYFGLDNPDAAPLLDPDGDGQNNRFEFIAGLVPIDAQSRFSLSIAPVAGQPGQKQVVFDPMVGGRSYTVLSSLDLVSWSPLIGGSISDDGDQRTVTDPAASETQKFYTVEIEKP